MFESQHWQLPASCSYEFVIKQYTVWVKKIPPPKIFWHFLPNGWEFWSKFYIYLFIYSKNESKSSVQFRPIGRGHLLRFFWYQVAELYGLAQLGTWNSQDHQSEVMPKSMSYINRWRGVEVELVQIFVYFERHKRSAKHFTALTFQSMVDHRFSSNFLQFDEVMPY